MNLEVQFLLFALKIEVVWQTIYVKVQTTFGLRNFHTCNPIPKWKRGRLLGPINKLRWRPSSNFQSEKPKPNPNPMMARPTQSISSRWPKLFALCCSTLGPFFIYYNLNEVGIGGSLVIIQSFYIYLLLQNGYFLIGLKLTLFF